jgi:riboflavin synthase
VIPHTLAVTTLGTKRGGDPVNLEVDIVAKYVERLLSKEGASVSRRGIPGRSERPQEAG